MSIDAGIEELERGATRVARAGALPVSTAVVGSVVVHARLDHVIALKHARGQQRRLIAANQNLHRMLDIHFVAHAVNRAFRHDITIVQQHNPIGHHVHFVQNVARNDQVHSIGSKLFEERDRFRSDHRIEAIERFDDDWGQVADHVGTRTREECVLQFLQLDIESKYLDSEVTESGPVGLSILGGGGGRLPFNQADNPVMSVIGFLASLADPARDDEGQALARVLGRMRAHGVKGLDNDF